MTTSLDALERLPFLVHPSFADENMAPSAAEPSVQVRDLTFAFPDGSTGLRDIALDLPPGSRSLLIGGKTYSNPCFYMEC